MLLAALAACQLFCSQVSGDNIKPSYPGPVPGGYLLPNGWTVTPVGKQVELSDLPLNIIVDGDKAFVAKLSGAGSDDALYALFATGETRHAAGDRRGAGAMTG